MGLKGKSRGRNSRVKEGKKRRGEGRRRGKRRMEER